MREILLIRYRRLHSSFKLMLSLVDRARESSTSSAKSGSTLITRVEYLGLEAASSSPTADLYSSIAWSEGAGMLVFPLSPIG